MIAKKYQVTLFCTNGKYKPVSTIVVMKQETTKNLIPLKKDQILEKGITNICIKRNWTMRELKEFGYIKAKMREYESPTM